MHYKILFYGLLQNDMKKITDEKTDTLKRTQCKKCQRIEPLYLLSHDRKVCRMCNRDRYRGWYESKPWPHAQLKSLKNKHRARGRAINEFTIEDYKSIFSRFNNRCAITHEEDIDLLTITPFPPDQNLTRKNAIVVTKAIANSWHMRNNIFIKEILEGNIDINTSFMTEEPLSSESQTRQIPPDQSGRSEERITIRDRTDDYEEIENMEDEEEDKNIKGDQENDESDDDKMIQVDPIAKDIDQNNGNNEVGSEDEGSSSGSENDNNVADSEAGGSSGGSESDDDEANSKDGGSSGDKGVGKESHSEESEDEMVKGDKDEGRASTGKGKRGKETMEDEENRETTEDEENEETMEDKENEETMEDEENEETMEDEDEGSLGGKDMGKESSSEESEDESGNNEQTISKSEDDREGRIQESCSAIHRKVSQGCHEVHMMGNLMDKWKDWGSAVIDGVYYRKQSGAFDAKERHSRSKDIIICSRQYDGTNACRCFFLTTREGLLQLTEDRNRVLKKPRDSGDLPKSPKGDIRTRWTDINQCSVSSGVDFYELVPSNQNVRMIFDTEMMTEVIKKNVSETDVWEAFEYLLSDFIHKEYERTVEWVVKDASDTSKISRHYVAQDVGLKDFVSGGGDMCRKFISFLQAMRTSDVEEVKKRAECLFYIEKGKEKCLVDDSIYTTNQNIRSLGSSKHVEPGKVPRMLCPFIGCRVVTDMDEKDYRDFFFKSCVCLTEEEANKGGMLWIEVDPNTKKRATGGQPSGQGSQKRSKGEESPRMPISSWVVNRLNELFGKCFKKEYKGALIDTSLSSVYTFGGLVTYEIYLENNLCVIDGSKNHEDKKQSNISLNCNNTWFHCFGSCGKRDDMKTQSILRCLSNEKVKDQLFSPQKPDSTGETPGMEPSCKTLDPQHLLLLEEEFKKKDENCQGIDPTRSFTYRNQDGVPICKLAFSNSYCPEGKTCHETADPCVEFDLNCIRSICSHPSHKETEGEETPAERKVSNWISSEILEGIFSVWKKAASCGHGDHENRKKSFYDWRKNIPKKIYLNKSESLQDWFDNEMVHEMNKFFCSICYQGLTILETSDYEKRDGREINPDTTKLFKQYQMEVYRWDEKSSAHVFSKKVSPFNLWEDSRLGREYSMMVFDPSPHANNIKYYNLFTGWDIEEVGEVNMDLIRPFLDHQLEIFANKDPDIFEKILLFQADIFQKPHVKSGICLGILSEQGSGKDTFFKLLEHILGKYYISTSNIDDIFERFNMRFASKLVIKINELASSGAWKNAQRWKSYITDIPQTFEEKFQPSVTLDCFARYIALTNNRDALFVEPTDRRYFPIEASNHRRGDTAYFDSFCLAVDNPVARQHYFTYLRRYKSKYQIMDLIKTNTTLKRDMKVSSLRGLPSYINRICECAKLDGYAFNNEYTYVEPDGDADAKEAYTFEVPTQVFHDSYLRYLDETNQNIEKRFNISAITRRMQMLAGLEGAAHRKTVRGKKYRVIVFRGYYTVNSVEDSLGPQTTGPNPFFLGSGGAGQKNNNIHSFPFTRQTIYNEPKTTGPQDHIQKTQPKTTGPQDHIQKTQNHRTISRNSREDWHNSWAVDTRLFSEKMRVESSDFHHKCVSTRVNQDHGTIGPHPEIKCIVYGSSDSSAERYRLRTPSIRAKSLLLFSFFVKRPKCDLENVAYNSCLLATTLQKF
ncbi:hypothetical protein PROFUN_15751 [Planoprotostelium fungivorum]|uniref:NrS-1 polymerase-like helicase domain-containing protein n=1 Tax=Planoprotostelium fungivorum TaxID=1890364 RepID=A0A2P6MUI5_9EUKA|nr:hypothetical protein PROFUN_15751 [Planoprotostelium fungivorum]